MLSIYKINMGMLVRRISIHSTEHGMVHDQFMQQTPTPSSTLLFHSLSLQLAMVQPFLEWWLWLLCVYTGTMIMSLVSLLSP